MLRQENTSYSIGEKLRRLKIYIDPWIGYFYLDRIFVKKILIAC